MFGLNEFGGNVEQMPDNFSSDMRDGFLYNTMKRYEENEGRLETDISWSSRKINEERPPSYQIPNDTICRQLNFCLDSLGDFDKFD